MMRPQLQTEWGSFTGPLFGLILSALAGAGLAWAGLAYQQQAVATQTQREHERQELENKHAQNAQAKEILEQYFVAFEQLQQRNFIGEAQQQRLTLGLYLERLKQRKTVPNLDYKIHEQRVYTPDNLSLPKDFQVYETSVDLRLDLLHEGELLEFISLLENQEMPGLLNVVSCALAQATSQTAEINLHTDCMALWYTVTVNREQEAAPP